MLIDKISLLIQDKKYKKALVLLKKSTPKTNKDRHQLALFKASCFNHLKQNKLFILELKEALANTKNPYEKIKVLKLLGKEYVALKVYDLAKEVFLTILEIDGSAKNADVRMLYSQLSYSDGDYETAEKYVIKLLNLTEYYAIGQQILCECAISRLDKKAAIDRLSQFSNYANTLEPNFIAYITHSYLKLNEASQSRVLIARLSLKYAKEPWFRVLMAMQAQADEEYEKVIKFTEDITIDGLPTWFKDKEIVLRLLANSHEKLKNYSKSFTYYQAHATRQKNNYKHIQQTDFIKLYSKLNLAELADRKVEQAEFTPVFMVGFPRSGTTLLETVLDTHPDILSLSESQTISNVIQKVNSMFKKQYPLNIENLSDEDIGILRKTYFEEVIKTVGNYQNVKCLVDKMPINTIHIPLIKLLFPKAKFIVSIRHPLDVVVSNFQQAYKINNEMSFLITLEDSAKRYNQVFDYYQMVDEYFNLDAVKVRYEDVVVNIEVQYRLILEFLSLPYIDGFKDFSSHARSKVISTTSNNQVSKPLYNSSLYKWKNYQSKLVHLIPVVEKHIEQFGYSVVLSDKR